jgi:hypothetical protein
MSNSTFEVEKDVCGLRLRPFTIGTMQACKALGLSLFTDPEAVKFLTQDEANRQVVALGWIQSADRREVVESIADGTAEKKISLFAWDITLEGVEALVAEVMRISGMVQKASVEVIQKPSSSSSKDNPPPN